MDFLVPAIAVIIGAAILAPGIVRHFKKSKTETTGCGGCAGCSNAGGKSSSPVQVVQLKPKGH
ncbi:MAG: FeoB-associated Cys-rich membrane protein [Deltaproteobacteria bacterium]|nr:FeoB-associated Cys-rich membrane protein [Deltaproteobacteria bacterium]